MRRILACLVAGLLGAFPACGQGLVEEWHSIRLPPAPELRAVTLEPATTALLMLDFMPTNCGRRPRCIASVPRVAHLLAEARAHGAPVVHSVIANTEAGDIMPELATRQDEPWVRAGPDKFLGTNLLEILRARGVRRVVVVGTASNGAVLATGSGAALRGFGVVLPLDGVSGDTAFSEAYVAWHMANAPGVAARTTLTSTDRIGWR